MVPAHSDCLQNTHEENCVNIEVVVERVEKSEAPIKAENGGSSRADKAEESSDD